MMESTRKIRLGRGSSTPLATLMVGVLLLGGQRSFADEPPRQKGKPPVGGYQLPPRATVNPEVAQPPYNGFFPSNGVSDETLDFQKKVAEVLRRRCSSYPARMEHFNWLNDDLVFQKTAYRWDGWGGVILEAKELPDGGWLAKVRMRPCVAAMGRSYVEDYVDEVYRYQNDVLTLVETDAAAPRPDHHRFMLY